MNQNKPAGLNEIDRETAIAQRQQNARERGQQMNQRPSLYDLAFQQGSTGAYRPAASAESMPAPENNQGFFGDAVDALQMGAAQAAGGLAETAHQITGSEMLGNASQALNNLAKDQINQMSDAGQAAMQKQFFTEDENGMGFGDAWSDPRAMGLQFMTLIGQMGAQVPLGYGIGTLGAKVAGKVVAKAAAKHAAGRGMTEEAIKHYAQNVTRATFGTAGQSLAGAGIAGGMIGNEARDTVLEMEDAELDQSPAFSRAYYSMVDSHPDMDVGQRRDLAKKMVADQVAAAVQRDPMLITTNLVLDAAGGYFIDRILRGVGTGSRLSNAGQQALAQGLTEMGQGGMEQYALNTALIEQDVDPTLDPMKGVMSNALNEAVPGAGFGLMMGGLRKGKPSENKLPGRIQQVDEEGRTMRSVETDPETMRMLAEQNGSGIVQPGPAMSLDEAVAQVKAERGEYRGIDDDIRIAEQQGFTDEAVRLRAAKRNFEMAADLIAEGDTESAYRFRERGNKIYRDVMEVTDPQYKGGLPAEYVAVGEMVERAGQFPAQAQPQGETVDGQATRVVPPTPALQHSTKGIPDSVDAPYYMDTTDEAKAAKAATERAFTEQQGQTPAIYQPPAPVPKENVEAIPYQKPVLEQAADSSLQIDGYDQDGYINFQPRDSGLYDPTKPPATDAEMEQDLQRLEQAASAAKQSESPTNIQAENGRKGRVKIGDKYEPVTFQLVDLAKNPQLAPTMQQDENQPRDRKRFSSNQQINKIAKELDFNELGESPRMSGGAPTITNDGKIIGGNGRTAAIRQAYANGTAENYRNELKARAREFGLTPAQIDAMEQPALVRRLQNPVDVVKAAIQSNDSGTMNMSQLEQARADSKLFGRTPSMELDDNGAINWNSPNNQPALKGFIAAIPQNEQNSMLDGRGFATPEAKNRFARMLMYRAFGNSRVLSNLIEDTDDNSRNLLAALESVAPRIAVINQQMAEGTLHRIDLSDYIVEAVELLESLRISGRNVTDYINQLDMVSVTSPVTNAIAAQLEENIRSRNALLNQLNGYYDAIVAAGHPDQGNLFGAAVPTLEEITGANRYARPEASQPEGAGRTGLGAERTPAPAEEQISADSGFTGAEPQAESADTGAEVDLLTPYSEQDIAQREAEQAEAASKEAAQQKAAEQKARADSEALDFTLSGSDRPADIAESRGQNSLFDTRGEPTTQDNEPAQAQANAGVSDAPIRNSAGKPFKNIGAARIALKKHPGYEIAKVEGGYELQPIPEGAATAANGNMAEPPRTGALDMNDELSSDVNSDFPASVEPEQVAQVRRMTANGRAADGKPIMPGDVFQTVSGRVTTPYPKQKSAKYSSQWLIDNATAEAMARGNGLAARNFENAQLLKGGELATADLDSMNQYLFDPESIAADGPGGRSILKPLNPAGTKDAKQSAEPKDWHTPLPDEGLALTPIQRDGKPDAHRGVTALIAADAYDSMTRMQLTNGQAMSLYYLPESNGRNGAARFIPDGQPVPSAWRKVEGGELSVGAMTREQAVRRITDLLSNAEVIGSPVSTEKPISGSLSKPASKPRSQSKKPESDKQTKPLTGNAGIPSTEGSKLDAAADKLSAMKREKAAALAEMLKKRYGRLNSGIDPEVMIAMAELGAITIAQGTVKFAQWARDIIREMRAFGVSEEEVKPFLKQAYGAITNDPERFGVDEADADLMDNAKTVRNTDVNSIDLQDTEDDLYTPGSAESDSQNGADTEQSDSGSNGNERPGEGGRQTEEAGSSSGKRDAGTGESVDGGSAPAAGERSNSGVRKKKSGVVPSASGDTDYPGSGESGTGRLFAEREGAGEAGRVPEAAAPEVASPSLGKQPKEAASGSEQQIAERMPFLDQGQVGDVAFVENRLSKPEGYGALLTNGTGTGKTFSGLGVVRRFMDQGKNNVLIVTPSRAINNAWVKAGGKFFGIQVNELPDTDSAGKGVVVTTFANFGSNKALFSRQWDLIVLDEAHKLSQNQEGDATASLIALRGLAMKPGSEYTRTDAIYSDLKNKIASVSNEIDLNKKSSDDRDRARNPALERELEQLNQEWNEKLKEQRKLIEDMQKEKAPRALMLSATPFSYEKNVQLGQGFLFDWGSDKDGSGAYNSGGNYERFMMQHFGYRMRYNKLTQPDAKVDTSLMQRNFNSWLKQEGVLRGRVLETDFDYDRKFILTESAIGRRVDAAFKWLFEHENKYAQELLSQLRDSFNYHSRMYFLEGIKAIEAVPIIRKNLELGRKVLIMHGFKKGGMSNPFRLYVKSDDAEEASLQAEYMDTFSDLIDAYDNIPSAINTLKRAFPDLLVYNGDVPPAERLKLQDRFNDDNDNAPMLAQGAAMREGVSIHDTTGKRQRVLLHLGMPSEPSATIQQEGRIYRVGQASNAIFRYMTIGTNWERYAFASRIASRASTAENLAMGELARGLKEAFIEAYEQADYVEPGQPGEGTGGKQADRAKANLLTDWDKAIAYYYGTKKQGSGRSSRGREGKDYFATPEPVGLKMVEMANIMPGENVLEPSAGHGAIGRWFPENSEATAIEPSDELSSVLALRFPGKILQDTFENHHIGNKYNAIVMNPPYGSGGKTAADHVGKAMKHLRNQGRIVALIPTGPAADKQFEKLLSSEEAADVYEIASIAMPAVTFERAGTSVATRIIVLEKQTDKELAAKLPSVTRDYSQAETINDLFDRIKDMEIPGRTITVEEPEAGTAGTKVSAAGVSVHTMDSKHSQKGHALYVVNIEGDLADNFEAMRDKAKANNGFYIAAKMRAYYKPSDGVTVPGKPTFNFSTEQDRANFLASIADDSDGLQDSDSETMFSRQRESRGEGNQGEAVSPLSVSAIEQIIGRTIPHVKNQGNYRIFDDVSALFEAYPAVKKSADKQGSDGSDIGGVWHDGKILIVRNKITRPVQVESLIFHEATHGGVKAMLADTKISKAAADLFDAMGGTKGFIKIMDELGLSDKLKPYMKGVTGRNADGSPKMDRRERSEILVHELLAFTGEKVSQGVRQKARELLGAIRNWLRKNGFASLSQLSVADISYFAKVAREYGLGGELGREQTLFLRAYHGTPHTFDRFSLRAIGSGEGIQAYGWGLYFASNRAVAEYYRDAVSGLTVDGRTATSDETKAFSVLKDNNNDITAAVNDGRREVERAGEYVREIVVRRQAVLESWAKKMPELSSSGNLYQVDIPEESSLLDYDKPISQQPEQVRRNLLKLKREMGDLYPLFSESLEPLEYGNTEGNDLYRALVQDTGSPEQASRTLNNAGIPGLKYADAGSRYIGAGDGSSNYVIWDDRLVSVEAVNDEVRQANALPQTETAAFRKWFRGSKVVDAQGKPLVVYHGTTNDFTSFDKGMLGSKTGASDARQGFFFAENGKAASEFTWASGDMTGSVMPAYLSLKNPLVVDIAGEWMPGKYDAAMAKAKSEGHDGLIVRGATTLGIKGDYYVAFEPTQIKSAIGNNGNFDGSNPDILFRQSDGLANDGSLTGKQPMADNVREWIAGVEADLGVKIEVVETKHDLPESVKADLGSAFNDAEFEGFYNPANGRTYLIASNLTSPAAAVRAALHEALGHGAVINFIEAQRKKGGKELDQVLDDIYRQIGKKLLMNKIQRYGLDLTKERERREAVLEYIAHVAEEGKKMGMVRRVVAALRDFIRKVFPGIGWNDTDTLALIAKSKLHLQQEGARGIAGMNKVIRRDTDDTGKPQTETAAFRKWFGGSKVVDAQGKPLVVYHGSPDARFVAEDGEFKSLHGRYGMGRSEQAHWFARSRQVAATYADDRRAFDYQRAEPAIIEAYLKLENPLEVDGKGKTWREAQERGKTSDVIEQARAEGRDGVIIRNVRDNYNDWEGGSRSSPTDTYVVFSSEQIKSATDNNGNFDGRNPNILFRLSDALANDTSLTDDQKEALSYIGPKSAAQTAMDRVRDTMTNWRLKVRQGLTDRYAALLELDKQLLNGNVTSEENITKSAWVKARMSNAAGGAVSAMMNAGRIVLDADGVIDVKKDTSGLIYTLNQLGSAAEVERFFGWIAGNRGEKLMAEGRENLFSPKDIAALKDLNTGTMPDGRDRNATYERVFAEFQQHRNDVLAIAEKAGIITSENREMWANEFYVPFYRLDEEADQAQGPRIGGGLSRQQAYKKLKGGTQNLNDLLQNTIMNFHHLLDASLKNMAAIQAVDNALELGVVEQTVEADRDKKQSTFVLREGKKVWYDVADPLVFQALTSLNPTGMNSTAMKVMRWFKRTFTNLTTSTPQFIVANLIRDSLSAISVTDMKYNAAGNVVQGLKSFGLSDRTGYQRARLMASGGAFSFGHAYGEDAEFIRYQIDGQMRRGKLLRNPKALLGHGLKPLQAAWDRWQDVNNSFENANRMAAFEQAEAAGKGKLYAAFQARDLMDFSASGAWPAVRFLIDVVPFLNARLQGLDKLYRSGVKPTTKVVMQMLGVGSIETSVTERQAAARFGAVVAALSVATMALYLRNQDDEDYQKAEDWMKDTYWWIRIPGTQHVGLIPKPFEVGAIATLTERLLEQAVNDKATGKLFAERLWHMIGSTFAFSPVPQMLQPAFDVYANRDSFTGRDIETMGQQRLSPSKRVNDRTTLVAEMMGTGLEAAAGPDSKLALSPVQIDYLISGYFGQVGAWMVGHADVLKNALSSNDAPARHWYEYQPIRRFYRNMDDPQSDKQTTLFYESLRDAARLHADVQQLKVEGNYAEAAKLQRENKDILAGRLTLDRVNRKVTAINARIKAIKANQALSADEKRRQIDLLQLRKKQLIDRVMPVVEKSRQ